MPTETESTRFSLYHHRACPFCSFTRSVLQHIDVAVEERDIVRNPEYRKELVAGGGKGQVPCLRIDQDGEVQWLYESRAIVRYLQQEQLCPSTLN